LIIDTIKFGHFLPGLSKKKSSLDRPNSSGILILLILKDDGENSSLMLKMLKEKGI
jgi:hypothetical protein